MKLIVCVDNRGGMSFFSRRLSKDKLLCQRILELTAGSRLWMSSYSASLFAGYEDRVLTCQDFLTKAGQEDYCFVENVPVEPVKDRITGLILYRWNRDYPADLMFPSALLNDGWHLRSKEDFAGNSHDCITEEIYDLWATENER